MEQQQKKFRKSTKAKKSFSSLKQQNIEQQRSNKLRPQDFILIKKQNTTGMKQDGISECVARFKIIIVGDSAVGKSSIMLKATKNLFKQEHQLTIGVDFGGLLGKIGDDVVKLQVWDTAGTQQFRSVTRIFYRDASCVIFVFAISKKKSFDNIQRWINQVQTNTDPGTVFVLVGNKSDLQERQVELQEAISFAKKRGIQIILETSAALGTNIDNLFSSIGFTLYQRYLISQEQLMRNSSFTYSTKKRSSKSAPKSSELTSLGSQNKQKKRGCC